MSEHVRAAVRNLHSAPPSDDVAALERLVVGYALCADFVLLDELAQLFTEEAVWDGTEFGFGRHVGREAIRAVFADLCGGGVLQVHFGSPLLSWGQEPGRAAGISYFSALRKDDSGVSRQAFGCYEDSYERAESSGIWRFAQRSLRFRLAGR